MITVLAQALSVLVLVASVVLVVADVRAGGLTAYEERAIEQAEDNQLNAAHLLMVNECLDPSQGPVWLDRRALR